jgi:hypothetical protein
VKKLFLTLTIIGLGAAVHAAAPAGGLFKDLGVKDPAYPYIIRMVTSYEAISGYPDGKFRGQKTITRAEFAKVLGKTVAYLEKRAGTSLAGAATGSAEVKFKDLPASHWAYPSVVPLVQRYKLLSGYPDGTFRPNKPINRLELSTVLAKTVKLVYGRYNVQLPTTEAVKIQDARLMHWAANDIYLLLKLGIITPYKGKKVWEKNATRADVAVADAKLIGRCEKIIAALPPARAAATAESRVAQALVIPSRPQTAVSAGWGNVYESASGTNNWLGFNAAVTYGDKFNLWRLSGNYELTGKYGYNQIVYLVPGSGGVVGSSVNNEHRYELEVNTIYPVVDIWGISGKLLLGAKAINLSNPTAPTNFTGFNAGLVTAARAFGRNILLRGFWSLPLARAQVSPSALGQPAQLFDYEASVDAELFSLPLLLGFSGETMTMTGSGTRYYNMVFARYYLL